MKTTLKQFILEYIKTTNMKTENNNTVSNNVDVLGNHTATPWEAKQITKKQIIGEAHELLSSINPNYYQPANTEK